MLAAGRVGSKTQQFEIRPIADTWRVPGKTHRRAGNCLQMADFWLQGIRQSPLVFLTSRNEVPTLTPFSSSACGRPLAAPREGRADRTVVGAPGMCGPRPPGPSPTARLVEPLG